MKKIVIIIIITVLIICISFFAGFLVNEYGIIHMGIFSESSNYIKESVDDDRVETEISINYKTRMRPLNLVTDAQIKEILENGYEANIWGEQVKNQLLEFGDIARQYLPYDKITSYYEKDLDGDGVKEKLLTLCGIGAGHCSDYAEIIKGNYVIFSTDFLSNSKGMIPNDNGFLVSWTDENSFINKRGESTGEFERYHNETVFSFKDGKFTPIKQWKVAHIFQK